VVKHDQLGMANTSRRIQEKKSTDGKARNNAGFVVM
jgi:hypothetical protein